MKTLHATCLLAALSFSSHSFGQDPVVFKRTFTNGLIEKFKAAVKFDFAFKMDGESSRGELDLTHDLEFRYSEVDKDGRAKLQLVSTNFKGDEIVEGTRDKLEDPESYDSTFEGKVNPLMQVTDFKEKKDKADEESEEGPDLFDLVFESVDPGTDYYRLPATAVKPGDTWKFELDPRDFFKKGQFLEGKFRGVEQWKGESVLAIVYDSNLDVDADLPKLLNGEEAAADMGSAKLTGTVKAKRTLLLHPITFRILESVESTTAKLEFTSSEFNLELDLKFDTTLTKSE